MVAVSNSLAMYATHPESDIDLFIITANRRLWIVRTLVLLIATILRVRVKPGDEAGKFCFPFFMTDKNLSLKNIALPNDIYLAYWIHTLKPIYNTHYIYGRFMKMNETFCQNILGIEADENTQFTLLEENRAFLKRTRRSAFFAHLHLKNPLSPFLDLIDTKIRELSMKRIQKQIIPSENTEGITIHENMIKIHFNDRRKEISEQVLLDE
jgi:hypothetical protein